MQVRVDSVPELVGQEQPLGLRDSKGLHHLLRVVELFLARVETALAHLEAALESPSPEASQEPTRRGPKVAQHEVAAHPLQLPGSPVVVAHERLGGQKAPFRFVAEIRREALLQVQCEVVVLAAAGEVELVAHPREKFEATPRDVVFASGEPPLVMESGEAPAAEARVPHPQDRMEVAKTP